MNMTKLLVTIALLAGLGFNSAVFAAAPITLTLGATQHVF